MIRPSVIGPTGTRICEPVSVTGWPRVRPSVESIAIVRTVDFAEMLGDLEDELVAVIVGLSADRISGRSLSNVTSTTAPITWLDSADIVGLGLRRWPFCYLLRFLDGVRALPRPR